MKRTGILIFAVLSLMVMLSSSVFAIGIGGFFTYGEGMYEYPPNEKNKLMGGGLLLDTAVAKHKLFNYRLEVTIDQYNGNDGDIDYEEIRVAGYNNFGFGLIQTQSIRLWIGPQIGIIYGSGNNDGSYSDDGFAYSTERAYKTIWLSAGAVVGLNINPGGVFTFTVTGGIREYAFLNIVKGTDTYTSSILTGEQEDVSGLHLGYGYEGFINVGVIFRINDNY